MINLFMLEFNEFIEILDPTMAENGTKTMTKGQGFFIPKNTLVRIFNAGQDELVLVEVLRPAYKKELVQELSDFTQ